MWTRSWKSDVVESRPNAWPGRSEAKELRSRPASSAPKAKTVHASENILQDRRSGR